MKNLFDADNFLSDLHLRHAPRPLSLDREPQSIRDSPKRPTPCASPPAGSAPLSGSNPFATKVLRCALRLAEPDSLPRAVNRTHGLRHQPIARDRCREQVRRLAARTIAWMSRQVHRIGDDRGGSIGSRGAIGEHRHRVGDAERKTASAPSAGRDAAHRIGSSAGRRAEQRTDDPAAQPSRRQISRPRSNATQCLHRHSRKREKVRPPQSSRPESLPRPLRPLPPLA